MVYSIILFSATLIEDSSQDFQENYAINLITKIFICI